MKQRSLLMSGMVTIALVITSTVAWAYLTAPASGHGSGTVARLASPSGVAANANGHAVAVTWTGVDAPTGGQRRHDAPAQIGVDLQTRQAFVGGIVVEQVGQQRELAVRQNRGAQCVDERQLVIGAGLGRPGQRQQPIARNRRLRLRLRLRLGGAHPIECRRWRCCWR